MWSDNISSLHLNQPIQNTENKIHELTASINNKNDVLANKSENINKLNNKIDGLKSQINSLKETQQQIVEKKIVATLTHNEKQSKVQKKALEVLSLKTANVKIGKFQRILNRIPVFKDRYEKKQNLKNEKLQYAERFLTQQKEYLNEIKDQIKEYDTQFINNANTLQEKETEIGDLSSQKETLEREIHSLRSETSVKQGEINDLKYELDQLNAQLDVLKTQEKELQKTTPQGHSLIGKVVNTTNNIFKYTFNNIGSYLFPVPQDNAPKENVEDLQKNLTNQENILVQENTHANEENPQANNNTNLMPAFEPIENHEEVEKNESVIPIRDNQSIEARPLVTYQIIYSSAGRLSIDELISDAMFDNAITHMDQQPDTIPSIVNKFVNENYPDLPASEVYNCEWIAARAAALAVSKLWEWDEADFLNQFTTEFNVLKNIVALIHDPAWVEKFNEDDKKKNIKTLYQVSQDLTSRNAIEEAVKGNGKALENRLLLAQLIPNGHLFIMLSGIFQGLDIEVKKTDGNRFTINFPEANGKKTQDFPQAKVQTPIGEVVGTPSFIIPKKIDITFNKDTKTLSFDPEISMNGTLKIRATEFQGKDVCTLKHIRNEGGSNFLGVGTSWHPSPKNLAIRSLLTNGEYEYKF